MITTNVHQSQQNPGSAPTPDEAANDFFLTSLNPPSNIATTSKPRTTARVTIAPITPATAFEIPDPLLDDDDDDDVADAEEDEAVELAQTPVVLPQT